MPRHAGGRVVRASDHVLVTADPLIDAGHVPGASGSSDSGRAANGFVDARSVEHGVVEALEQARLEHARDLLDLGAQSDGNLVKARVE